MYLKKYEKQIFPLLSANVFRTISIHESFQKNENVAVSRGKALLYTELVF